MGKEQVVVVTGASSGIGKSTVMSALKDKHVVYALARSVDKMKDLEDLGAKIILMDITDEKSVGNAVDEIMKNEKNIDVLVNNAGYGSYGAVEDVEIDEGRYQFEVNIFGLASITKKIIPYMRENRSGKIINITSIGGKIHTPFGAWYHGTKFALEGFSDCLRLELEPFGIDVVVVGPGAIKTNWSVLAKEYLLKASGRGAYKEQVNKLAKEIERNEGSDPIVIGDLIRDIIQKEKPKTRYYKGKYAVILLFFRKILSDRMFDKLINSMIR